MMAPRISQTARRRTRTGAILLIAGILGGACTGEKHDATARPPLPPVEMAAPPGQADAASFRERVFYEVWVRSFQDSDGDGIGDLAGLTSRLDELADLGIGGLWLMPTFPSPLIDSGYDVADYLAVHPDYGDLEDMRTLVREAHARGILVWLDMVFNHVSDQHHWFQSALTGPESPWFDWFVWSPEPATTCSDVPNALTPFGTDRWAEVPELDRWYFHQFYPRQPDLNFDNPAVGEALLDVLRFWIDLGVDGFRFDVPDRFYERGQRCAMLPETRAFHARMREVIGGAGGLDRGFVGEIWGLLDEVMPWFGSDGNPSIFAFELMLALVGGALIGEQADLIARAVELHLDGLPDESRWAIILGNHDTPRVASLAAGDLRRVRVAKALQLTLPGIPFIWAGDELGLEMGRDSLVDGRDGTRTPYPWTPEVPGFGFTTAAQAFLPATPDSRRKAWSLQRGDPDSLLEWTRRLIALRNATPALHAGDYRTLAADRDRFVFERRHGDSRRIVAVNVSRERSAEWRFPAGPDRRTTWRDLLDASDWLAGEAVVLPPLGVRILAPANEVGP